MKIKNKKYVIKTTITVPLEIIHAMKAPSPDIAKEAVLDCLLRGDLGHHQNIKMNEVKIEEGFKEENMEFMVGDIKNIPEESFYEVKNKPQIVIP